MEEFVWLPIIGSYLLIGIPVFFIIFLLVLYRIIAHAKTADTRWQTKTSMILVSGMSTLAQENPENEQASKK